MQIEIQRHQWVQELQGQIQEIFIVAYKNKYTIEKTIDVIKCLFDTRQDEILYAQFRSKYGQTQANEQETKQG